jgi:hypothetical protein
MATWESHQPESNERELHGNKEAARRNDLTIQPNMLALFARLLFG